VKRTKTFNDTLDLVRRVGYGQAYSFKYSARPGTPAAERADVPPEVASARLQELQALLTEQQRAAQAGMVGREVKVLFEKKGRREGQLIGKSEYLHAVHAEAPDHMIGQVIPGADCQGYDQLADRAACGGGPAWGRMICGFA
jgi:tRNA-2-methylthio-N6-dimethylallyladenosine synthase